MSTTTASMLTLEQLDELVQPLKAAFDEQDGQDAPTDCEKYPIGELIRFSQEILSLANSLTLLAYNTLGEVHRRA